MKKLVRKFELSFRVRIGSCPLKSDFGASLKTVIIWARDKSRPVYSCRFGSELKQPLDILLSLLFLARHLIHVLHQPIKFGARYLFFLEPPQRPASRWLTPISGIFPCPSPSSASFNIHLPAGVSWRNQCSMCTLYPVMSTATEDASPWF